MSIHIKDMPSMLDPVKRGWIITYDVNTGDAVADRSLIRQRSRLTLAKRTCYCAKYSPDENGMLDIGLPGRQAAPNAASCFFRNPAFGEFSTPDSALPGSNDFLQAILECGHVAVQYKYYDDTTWCPDTPGRADLSGPEPITFWYGDS